MNRTFLLGLAVSAALLGASPARATCDNSENIYNWYYITTDSSPTMVWASARGQYVATSDTAGGLGGYVAFIGDPENCARPFATAAELWAHINDNALAKRKFSYNTISSAADITLTNPTVDVDVSGNDLASYTKINMSVASKIVTLPAANLPMSMPMGRPFRIEAALGANAFQIKDSSGNSLISSLTPGSAVDFVPNSFASSAGAYINWRVFGGGLPLPETYGGTSASSLGGALNGAVTGDVTFSLGGASSIAADAVTNTKLANMADSTIKCRTTAGTGDPEDCTVAQVNTLLSVGQIEACITADMNSTADQAIVVPLPAGKTRMRVQAILASNPSKSFAASIAAGGIYTAAAKGGTAIVAAATTYTGLTTSTANTTGSLSSLTVVNVNTAFYQAAAAETFYLSLTTADGTAGTIDFCVLYNPLK